MNIRIYYTLAILVIDFIYVYMSRHTYGKVFASIQHGTVHMSTQRLFVSILGAYSCMALGWYYLVATKIEQLVGNPKSNTVIENFLKGAWCGFLYAALVYGVYDFTQFATLGDWSGYIMYRDLAWGFASSIILSGIYAVVLYK